MKDNSTAGRVIRGIMENFPEASQGSSLICRRWDYAAMDFTFFDCEEEKSHRLGSVDFGRAFGLLASDKWPRGCTPPPRANTWAVWQDWLGQADAMDFDAFVQLAIFGEVIYG